MDTKFSMALHILVFISETDKVASSEMLAESVGTNASHIRKITRLLKQAQIIDSQQGKSGFNMLLEPTELDLADVYRAVYADKVMLHVHDDTNPECPVGQHIGKVLMPTFSKFEVDMIKRLGQHTLADIIAKLYQSRKEDEFNESSSSKKIQ